MLEFLDVALGLIFVFTLLSLLTSAVTEWISALLSMRGDMLWDAVSRLVGNELEGKIRDHGLIQGLVHPSLFHRLTGRLRDKPTYLHTQTFLVALQGVLPGAENRSRPWTFEELRHAVAAMEHADARSALLALLDDAEGDLDRAKKNIGKWYESSMERLSGRYRRWSQQMIFAVGLCLAVFFGVDAVDIAKALYASPPLRGAVFEAAQSFIADEDVQGQVDSLRPGGGSTRESAAGAPDAEDAPVAAAAGRARGSEEGAASAAETSAQIAGIEEHFREAQEVSSRLQKLRLPLEPWRPGAVDPDTGERISLLGWLLDHWLGVLLSAFATTFGAPFWFDLLSQAVRVRTNFKPPEAKEKAEGDDPYPTAPRPRAPVALAAVPVSDPSLAGMTAAPEAAFAAERPPDGEDSEKDED